MADHCRQNFAPVLAKPYAGATWFFAPSAQNHRVAIVQSLTTTLEARPW